ncbi:MAG TPA: hypothetical protein VMF06_23695 [Candidatus Limnocylindria bacterium]|nr:hypothetical protein [Candidatus Limnocylindria bacterium]
MRIFPTVADPPIRKTILIAFGCLCFRVAALGAELPTNPAVYQVGDSIEYRLGKTWFGVSVVKVDGERYYVHRDGKSTSEYLTWNRWATGDELRPLGNKTIELAKIQAGENKLDGLYLQIQTSMFGGRISFSYQYYWFRPDGNIYFGVPPGGLAKPGNFGPILERDPKNCGHYGVSGGKLNLQRNGEKPATFDFSTEGGDAVLHFNGPALVRVGQFKEKQSLEANYEGGNSAAGGGVFVSASGNFHFHADGTFDSGSVVSFDSKGDKSAASGGSTQSNQGQYQLGGNTLQLTYSDGKSVSFTVFPYPDKEEFPPEHMGINGQIYKLQPGH